MSEANQILSGKHKKKEVVVTSLEIAGDGRELEKEITLNVRPFTVHQWVDKLIPIVEKGALEMLFGALGQLNLNDILLITNKIVVLLKDDLETVLAMATRRDVAFFDTILPDDGIKIAQAIYEVNYDFFMSNILPLLKEMFPTIEEVIKEKATEAGAKILQFTTPQENGQSE